MERREGMRFLACQMLTQKYALILFMVNKWREWFPHPYEVSFFEQTLRKTNRRKWFLLENKPFHKPWKSIKDESCTPERLIWKWNWHRPRIWWRWDYCYPQWREALPWDRTVAPFFSWKLPISASSRTQQKSTSNRCFGLHDGNRKISLAKTNPEVEILRAIRFDRSLKYWTQPFARTCGPWLGERFHAVVYIKLIWCWPCYHHTTTCKAESAHIDLNDNINMDKLKVTTIFLSWLILVTISREFLSAWEMMRNGPRWSALHSTWARRDLFKPSPF